MSLKKVYMHLDSLLKDLVVRPEKIDKIKPTELIFLIEIKRKAEELNKCIGIAMAKQYSMQSEFKEP